MICSWCKKFIGNHPHVVSAQHLPQPGQLLREQLCVECADKLSDALLDAHAVAKSYGEGRPA